MKKLLKLSLLIVLVFAIKSCSDDDNGTTTPVDDSAAKLEATKKEYVANYVNIVEASYNDALSKTNDLKTAIDAFVDAPDATKFQAAKDAWLAAREPYGQTEAYRFYKGPIDGDEGEPEGYINAWPLDEGLIDYVANGTDGSTDNIIADATIELNEEKIRSINGKGGETNVTIGYHAIEFLLWGQDNTAPADKKAGQRAFTDYTTAANATRRGQYLKVAIDILIKDLKSVVDQWKDGAAYRKEFLALSSDDAINKILTGAAKLSKGELAGERMFVAIKNQSQEDEHSCFADNTHRDIYLNAESINNIINGTYKKVDGTTVSGTSLLDVLKLVNETETTTLQTTAKEVMDKVKVISDAKFFDNQIMNETIDNNDKPVMSAVSSLEKQGDELAQAGKSITGKAIDPSLED